MTNAPGAAARLLNVLVLAGAVALLGAGSGVGAGPGGGEPAESAATGSHHGHHPGTHSKPAQVLTVQQLATTLGCEADVFSAADYRQVTCTAAGARHVLLDFDTADGQSAWLDLAVSYGGIYLTGDRWALSGNSKEYLETLQATLGGTIQGDGGHGSSHR